MCVCVCVCVCVCTYILCILHRLPNSSEDLALLSQDLSGLDLSDYVLLEHGDGARGSPTQTVLQYM